MQNCELCGSGIRGEPQAVNIDGGIFRVCNSCAHLGTPARIPGRPNRQFSKSGGFQPRFGATGGRSSTNTSTPANATSRPPPRPSNSPPSATFEDQQVELTMEYAKIIKEAREMHGLSQEELGMKINEKPSVIHHLENGSMKPSDVLARKLEHFLKIQLFILTEEIEGQS
jgi:putative transcription factor